MEPQVPKRSLKKAVSENPQDIDARLRLAIFYRKDNNPDKAVKILEETIELDPKNPEIYLQLGLCWAMAMLDNVPVVQLWGREMDEEVMMERAIENLETASELDPEMTEAYNVMARLYMIRVQEEQAIDMFKQSLQIDPAQLDVLEELQELTGRPVWKLLDKETYMGEEEDI